MLGFLKSIHLKYSNWVGNVWKEKDLRRMDAVQQGPDAKPKEASQWGVLLLALVVVY